MVAAVRKPVLPTDGVEAAERVLSVPPRAELLSPWTDRLLPGFAGRIAIRETTGTGLPLILLHGNSSSKDAFRPQMDGALGSRHRMVAVDLPGHGASDDAEDPATGYTITGFADAVADVVEQLGLDRFALLGWSLGGHVALEVAASVPGAVGAMIVGTPPIGTTPADILPGFQAGPLAGLVGQASFSAEEAALFAAEMGVAGDDLLARALDRADGRARAQVFANALAGGAADERAIVAHLDLPLAVVNGANDPVVNLPYVEALPYKALWEGRVHTLPRTGHAPFRDAPDVFNALLGRFLHGLSREAAVVATFPGLCLGG